MLMKKPAKSWFHSRMGASEGSTRLQELQRFLGINVYSSLDMTLGIGLHGASTNPMIGLPDSNCFFLLGKMYPEGSCLPFPRPMDV